MHKIMEAMESRTVIRDPWSLLGVDRDTSLKDIKQARNALALASHPDKCPEPAMREEATLRMATINDAFVLATDGEAWSKYKKANNFEDQDDIDERLQQQSHESSQRLANAHKHQATSTSGQEARSKRRANLQARVDELRESSADGTCTAEAKQRWESYYARQAAINCDDLDERVAARITRDAELERERRGIEAANAVGAAIGQYDDARALVEEEGWTTEALAEEFLAADETDRISHKHKKAARRALAGEATEHRRRMQLKYETEHSIPSLQGGVSSLRLERGPGEADEEIEAIEEGRRLEIRRLEARSETKEFRAKWGGMLGNDAPVKSMARPLNKKEARQLKKLNQKSQ